MFVKLALLTFIVAVGADAHFATDLEPVIGQQQAILRLMQRSYAKRTAASLDDAEVDACFEYYLGEQDLLLNEYNKKYNGCLQAARNSKKELSAQSAEKRDTMLVRGNSVCEPLNNCAKLTDGLAFFQCYNNVSSIYYPELYSISTDSDIEVTSLQIRYQEVENKQRGCTTEARNKYVASMATSNSEMESCLSGESTVPPPTTTTTTTTTTEGTTTTTEDTTTTTQATTTTTEGTTTTIEDTTTTTEETTTTEATDDTTTTTEDIAKVQSKLSPEEDLSSPMRHMHHLKRRIFLNHH